MQLNRVTIEETIDDLWALYDEANNAGDKALASDYASQAFLLIEKIPENAVYLRDLQ